ncbi:MAG: DoxX family protein, partial [Marinilabiliales bacterium]
MKNNMAKHNKFLTNTIFLLRIVVGLVFVFSSFVKGVDPLGTAYRVEDYLEAYGWYSLVNYSLSIGIFLIITEFLLGISMLFRLKFKLGSLGVFLIMIIFTFVTYFDAKLELVPDCGCFGDAIKLTNWETFYKNIVLIVLAFFLFIFRKHAKQLTPEWFQWIVLLAFTFGFSYFIYYNLNHLPVIDFRNWKEGKNMKTIGEDEAKVYVSYKNKESGEIKEYLSPNYPWNDSVWKQNWEFIGQRFDNS